MTRTRILLVTTAMALALPLAVLLGLTNDDFHTDQFDKKGNPLPQGTPQSRGFIEHDYGAYAGDTYRATRELTLNVGVRYDYKRSHFPEQTIGDPTNPYGASRFVPVPFVIPKTDQLRWHDITPKMAAAYDLFGDGKTAVKGTINKYVVSGGNGGERGERRGGAARGAG